MSPDAEKTAKEALSLPLEERAALVVALIDSLETEEADRESVDEFWEQEIDRRIIEADAGKVNLEPWSKVRRRISSGE